MVLQHAPPVVSTEGPSDAIHAPETLPQRAAPLHACKAQTGTAVTSLHDAVGAQFVGPVFLNLLLNVVATGQSSARGYAYATLMLLGLELGTLADNQHFQRTMRAGGPPGYHLAFILNPMCMSCMYV